MDIKLSKIVTSVPQALDNLIPGMGKICLYTLRGNLTVNQSTLTRFYTLMLLLWHFSMLLFQGISGPL